jgi:hypothetical protein
MPRGCGSLGVSGAGGILRPRVTCRSGVPRLARLAAARDRDDVTLTRCSYQHAVLIRCVRAAVWSPRRRHRVPELGRCAIGTALTGPAAHRPGRLAHEQGENTEAAGYSRTRADRDDVTLTRSWPGRCGIVPVRFRFRFRRRRRRRRVAAGGPPGPGAAGRGARGAAAARPCTRRPATHSRTATPTPRSCDSSPNTAEQMAAAGRHLPPEAGLRQHRHHQHHRPGAPSQPEGSETADSVRSNALNVRFHCVR